jgi:hypothetical protein
MSSVSEHFEDPFQSPLCPLDRGVERPESPGRDGEENPPSGIPPMLLSFHS